MQLGSELSMGQALRVVYGINPRRFLLNCLAFCCKLPCWQTISCRNVSDCMPICMKNPCQNHWCADNIEVLVGSNNANVCFLYFSAGTTERTNETVWKIGERLKSFAECRPGEQTFTNCSSNTEYSHSADSLIVLNLAYFYLFWS